jgi:hypothetical protein
VMLTLLPASAGGLLFLWESLRVGAKEFPK